MDLEQAKDETLREPERAQGKPDTDGRRQPSEHVASAVSMAGQVAQQLCPDAGRAAVFVVRFAEDLGRSAAGVEGQTVMGPCGDGSWDGICGPWLLQAPCGHPLLTAMRVGRVPCKQLHLWYGMLAALPVRAHWAQHDAARRLLARSAGAVALAPASLLTLGAA